MCMLGNKAVELKSFFECVQSVQAGKARIHSAQMLLHGSFYYVQISDTDIRYSGLHLPLVAPGQQ